MPWNRLQQAIQDFIVILTRHCRGGFRAMHDGGISMVYYGRSNTSVPAWSSRAPHAFKNRFLVCLELAVARPCSKASAIEKDIKVLIGGAANH